MRVLHLGKYWRKDGGIETHVKTLCKSLASAGVDVVNLVSSTDQQGNRFAIDGYNVVESPTLGVYFSTSIAPRMVLDAKQLHAEQAFDLVHLHFPDPMSHLVSLTLPAHIPRVITWHSDIVKQRHLLKLYRPFQLRKIMRAKAIVAATPSHFASSTQITVGYPAAQKHVIPYGMDFGWLELTPDIQSQAAHIKAQSGGRFMVFALGRHVEYKGFDVLIRAMQHTSVYLVLGGEGPLTATLKTMTQQLGIADRVCFAGRLTESALAAHYHACDIFCLPSVTPNEAFGIVQIEAMACGKPVICTQLNNGVNDINPHMHTGLTIPASNHHALAQAIKQLQHDQPLRQGLGRNAQQHAHDKFSIKYMVNQHLALYAHVLTDSQG
jgi:glycosyltransferase involved in cell wall biosynthesis